MSVATDTRTARGASPITEAGRRFSLRDLTRGSVPLLPILSLFVVWELLSRSGLVIHFLLPPATEVLTRIGEDLASGDLLVNAGLTLYRAIVGFAIGAVAGVVIGLLMAQSRVTRWFFDPLVSLALPAPKIALLPIFMLWFGLFDTSKILMIAFNIVFIVILSTYAGTQEVEQKIRWSALSLGASRRRLLRDVVFPSALPQTLTGFQISAPIALIVALVTEFVMGGQGIGAAMLRSARYADSVGVFAGIVEIGVLGYLVIRTLILVRRWALPWHRENA